MKDKKPSVLGIIITFGQILFKLYISAPVRTILMFLRTPFKDSILIAQEKTQNAIL